MRPESATEVRWHHAQKLEALKNGDVVLDLPVGSLIEAKRFVLSLEVREGAGAERAGDFNSGGSPCAQRAILKSMRESISGNTDLGRSKWNALP